MEIRWLTALIDLPDDRYRVGATFWERVTETELSVSHGEDEQLATLVPPDGDPYVRLQRTQFGPRIHVDLHVDVIADARRTAQELGATVGADLGHGAMRSPTGMTFGLVSHSGESKRPATAHRSLPHRLDQVCIDVPGALFERELAFWQELTGWSVHRGQLEEFAVLLQPSACPLRLVFQRLGADDDTGVTRAHLDFSCGHLVDDVRQLHQQFGAEFVGRGLRWVTMRDPAGMVYCLTQRDPTTGQISG